jgi:hypothetical protein
MSTPFDFANFGSMFGGMQGGTPTGIDALFNEDQRKLMNRNAALSAAAALLQASGRSTTPIGLGQALGSALQAGQQGYQQARAGSLQDLMVGEKLKEAQTDRERNVDYFKLLEQAGQPAQPMQPLTGVAVPPVERFVSETAPMAGPAATGPLAGLSQQQLALMRGLPREKGLQFALDALKPEASPDAIKTLRALGLPPTLDNLRLLDKPEASPEAIRTLNALGLQPTLANLRLLDKPEASPLEVRLLNEAKVPVTLANIMKIRQSAASNVNVGGEKLNLTPGQKKVDEKFSETYIEWQTGGGADMVANIASIDSVLKKLEANEPLTGPMVGIQPDFIRAIANPKAADALERVQEVVQRNLRAVLGGAFTEREGAQLINRAYNPSLSPAVNAARLRKLFQQLSISGKQRQSMVDFFEENGTLQGYRGPRPSVNDFYKALEGGESGTQRKPLDEIFKPQGG